MEKQVYINDPHIPFQDVKALDLALTFIREFEPDVVWVLGDWIDCYLVSRFDKDPTRKENLQDEFDAGKREIKRLRSAAPNARIKFKDGNHEERLQKYLWRNAPELASLRDLTIRRQLGLDEYEVEYYTVDDEVEEHGMLQITHGDNVRKHSGWTARAHYDKYGGCGICGHSHRGGSYLITKRGDTMGWWENYCLCDLQPEYVKSPNWQQGFSLAYFAKDRFFMENIPIIQHKFVVGERLFTWKKKGKVV